MFTIGQKMPKGFSEQEKKTIRVKLMQNGSELFVKYGLKKTSVDDITRSVGISKGAFYLFFNTKEELLFEILETLEEKLQADFRDSMQALDKDPIQILKNHIMARSRLIESNQLTQTILKPDIFEALSRKLPKERLESHEKRDQEQLVPVLKRWQSTGKMVPKDPLVILGIMKALFITAMYKDQIGADIYGEVIETLTDYACRGLFPATETAHQNWME